MARVPLLLAVLTLCGCGSTLGAPCISTRDCLSAQTCLTSAPQGFCGHGCSVEGEARECPAGALCTPFGAHQVCSPTCQDDGACRTGYQCLPVGSQGLKSCRPAP